MLACIRITSAPSSKRFVRLDDAGLLIARIIDRVRGTNVGDAASSQAPDYFRAFQPLTDLLYNYDAADQRGLRNWGEMANLDSRVIVQSRPMDLCVLWSWYCMRGAMTIGFCLRCTLPCG